MMVVMTEMKKKKDRKKERKSERITLLRGNSEEAALRAMLISQILAPTVRWSLPNM